MADPLVEFGAEVARYDLSEKEGVTLSEQQQEAADLVAAWIADWDENGRAEPFFVLSGYAGTGKTFTCKTIVSRLGCTPAWMAYTGKAALVMRKYGGVPARTIHSSIYKVVITPNEVFKQLYKQRDAEQDAGKKKEIVNKIDELMKPRFELKSYEEAFPDGQDLIVLDECSMVDDVLLADLMSFRIPILALGDPGQLPPIDGTGALFKKAPNVTLTEIRRQSLDNPIIDWSMRARKKWPFKYTDISEWKEDKAANVPALNVTGVTFQEMFDHHDVCICWKNVTRQSINMWHRRHRGYNDAYPVKGEKLIITKNDRDLGIFNGQFCTVLKQGAIGASTITLMVQPEGTEKEITLKVLLPCFDVYRNPEAWKTLRAWDYKDTQQADWGYALTCHKAQGSQWEKVLVVEENALNWPKELDNRSRWLYTAVTRAVEKVTIITGRFKI